MSDTCTQTDCTNPGCRVHNPPPTTPDDRLPERFAQWCDKWMRADQLEDQWQRDEARHQFHQHLNAHRDETIAALETQIALNMDYAALCAKHEKTIGDLRVKVNAAQEFVDAEPSISFVVTGDGENKLAAPFANLKRALAATEGKDE